MSAGRGGGLPDKSWKACERRLAAVFGAKRTGAQGDTTYDFIAAPSYDVSGRRLGVEVKHLGSVPKWLTGAMEQSRGHAKTVTGPIDSIVIVLPKGFRKEKALVVLELEEYELLRRRAAGTDELAENVADEHSVKPSEVLALMRSCLSRADESDVE